MDIYKRIGEAAASRGKITSVLGLNEQEVKVLNDSGFENIGTIDLNGTIVPVFSIVHKKELQEDDWKEIISTTIDCYYNQTPSTSYQRYGKTERLDYSNSIAIYETGLMAFRTPGKSN